MSKTVLLYGATGFSGRLIAALACDRWRDSPELFRLELAGRSSAELKTLAGKLGVRFRVFALDEPIDVERGLEGVFAVINAAGPFDFTAEPLAKAALRAGAHYVDIAGETDVYKCLDDLGYSARQRHLVLVCGAGHTATVSDVMVNAALELLRDVHKYRELGAIRIALSRVRHISRGSLRTSWRAVREQVLVVRNGGLAKQSPRDRPDLHNYRVTHVPIGQLERTFDFAESESTHDASERKRERRRIACAVNLIDTLTARLTAARYMDRVERIESYLEVSGGGRLALQWGALAAPLLSIPGARALAQRQFDLLPEGPSEAEREEDRHCVVLEIDDIFGQTVIDWCMETPNPYDFTATCVLSVVEQLKGEVSPGWRTPAEVLGLNYVKVVGLTQGTLFEERCRLIQRKGAWP